MSLCAFAIVEASRTSLNTSLRNAEISRKQFNRAVVKSIFPLPRYWCCQYPAPRLSDGSPVIRILTVSVPVPASSSVTRNSASYMHAPVHACDALVRKSRGLTFGLGSGSAHADEVRHRR